MSYARPSLKRTERSLTGRFDDNRITGCNRGRELPRDHGDGEIPRGDNAADSYRLTNNEVRAAELSGYDYLGDLLVRHARILILPTPYY